MAWPRTKRPSTRHLLRAEHRPHVPQGFAWLGWAALVLLVLAALALGGWQLRASDDGQARERIGALEAKNAELTQELEERHLQAEEERANREQLMRRIDAMSAEIKKLKTELAFFRQQKPGK
ncbi:hypothetical protein N5J43_02510 [Pseudomonas nicosulfuronedens]|uniref:hypothetical protein n=1 Tax=Pseudomonas nicosulfuronedens TaxID=2571105 RepID=UPI001FE72242|nr:hypothetical protein [Pseudomonas nicosulfuronedens]MDH1007760.1 hypothetical protein [Pseudomonas nicosulfuronedens]MDH1977805.1 hypothetical protein [Pseudomonas nicosulfuronedens]MDH2025596.1 hypothetical protein [Pseudomonas nicosulfuronedens]